MNVTRELRYLRRWGLRRYLRSTWKYSRFNRAALRRTSRGEA